MKSAATVSAVSSTPRKSGFSSRRKRQRRQRRTITIAAITSPQTSRIRTSPRRRRSRSRRGRSPTSPPMRNSPNQLCWRSSRSTASSGLTSTRISLPPLRADSTKWRIVQLPPHGRSIRLSTPNTRNTLPRKEQAASTTTLGILHFSMQRQARLSNILRREASPCSQFPLPKAAILLLSTPSNPRR